MGLNTAEAVDNVINEFIDFQHKVYRLNTAEAVDNVIHRVPKEIFAGEVSIPPKQ